MPKRESEDYVHHLPNTARTTVPQQFTWSDALWMVIEGLTYIVGWCIHISIIVEKFDPENPLQDRGFYVFYFLLAHISAGLKNVQYHHRESNANEDEEGLLGWIMVCLFFPLSPLYRLIRCWRFGLAEKDDPENGVRFVDEMVTVGVLRLFDIVLGDFPFLILLVKDDVLARSEDWLNLMAPPYDPLTCGGLCGPGTQSTLTFWTIFRMFVILSKMAQGMTFYIAMMKRLNRVNHSSRYSNIRGANARQGRLNIFAAVFLFLAHYFFIASRILGYGIVSQGYGAWVYLVIGLRWIVHTTWHLLSLLNTHGITPARSVSSFTMGGVWLVALTNEEGGRQLGRFLLYYGISFAETLICGFMWNGAMKESGDYFAFKASWATLITFAVGLLLHATYYALLHPGTPSISKEGLRCCTGDRQDPDESDDEDDNRRHRNLNPTDHTRIGTRVYLVRKSNPIHMSYQDGQIKR